MSGKRIVIPARGGTGDLSETFAKLADALEGFAATLSQSEVMGNAQELLPRALQMAARFDLERAAVADACQVSEPTVSRWSSGKVKPHIIVARAAIDAIAKLALKKAEECHLEHEEAVEGVI